MSTLNKLTIAITYQNINYNRLVITEVITNMVNEETGGPFIVRRAKSAHSERCDKSLSKLSNKHNLRATKSHREFYATRAQKNPDVKFARPQSVLPMERSMFYYSENSTGFIKPQKVTPHPKDKQASLLTNRSSNSLISSCKPIKRSSLLPFSKITVLKLNAPSLNRSNNKTQPVKETLVLESPTVTFGRPVSKASSKLPIFCQSQQSNSRPQSSFAKYYNVSSPVPMSVSQYRNYLLNLHERGIGRNSDSSAMLNWVNLERNEDPGTGDGVEDEGEKRVSKVGFKTSRNGYPDGVSNLIKKFCNFSFRELFQIHF